MLEDDLKKNWRKQWREECVKIVLLLCALISVAATIGIIFVLVKESFAFFIQVSPWEFLFGTNWSPLLMPRSFGVLPLVCGTFLVVAGASLIAIPVGLTAAIYLSEYASPRARNIVKPVLEVLAGIPTVVYGYFALTFISPILQFLFPSAQVFNAASAAIVVGIMILPMVASLCDDSLRAVPDSLRQGAYAVGATSFEVSTRIVVPGALSGIMASFVLALSRAIGETMAVTLAAGATPKLTLNPLESIQTMTAYIVQVSLGDTPAGTLEYQTIFAVGLLLFAITLGSNLIAHQVLGKYREVYQ
ncbi:MAG: phosphate ABC transporter permease subunit PstC [Nitrospinae bacterium]|nr:phosphate ABC transporter permease subunit PstC [Nitrospinota bacterium]